MQSERALWSKRRSQTIIMIVGFKIDDDQCNSASLARQSWYPNVTLGYQPATALALTLGPGCGRSFASIAERVKAKGRPAASRVALRSRAACQSKMIGRVDRVGLDEISQQTCNRDLSQHRNNLVARARVERRRGRFRCYQSGEQAKIHRCALRRHGHPLDGQRDGEGNRSPISSVAPDTSETVPRGTRPMLGGSRRGVDSGWPASRAGERLLLR